MILHYICYGRNIVYHDIGDWSAARRGCGNGWHGLRVDPYPERGPYHGKITKLARKLRNLNAH